MTLKYNSSGQLQWSNTFGSFTSLPISTIATKSGNIYTAGLVPEVYGLKVVKYDESGAILDSCSNSETFIINAFIMDDDDNSYYIGAKYGSGGTDIFLLKYDSILNLSWQKTYIHSGNDMGISLALDNNKNIYALGYLYNSSIYYTSVLIKYDSLGNQKWYRIYNSPFNMATKGVKVVCDKQNNVIVGVFVNDTINYHYSAVKYSTEGNLIWERYIPDSVSYSNELFDMKLDNKNNIYMFGYSGRISTSYDYLTTKLDSAGNIKWNRIYASPGNIDDYPHSICVDNFCNSYVTGSTVTIKYDSSGIIKWLINNSYNNYFYDGAFILIDKYYSVYLTGDGNVQGNINCFLLKFSQSVGVINQNQNIVNNYILFQNYPNPFNLSSNIKYQISKSDFVNLKIYDIVGKEIATLVNEKQSPGTYEVSFDGTNYPSGVYFYKLIAGDYSETKKMVLIK